jgi:excisionase family DNA binding protein
MDHMGQDAEWTGNKCHNQSTPYPLFLCIMVSMTQISSLTPTAGPTIDVAHAAEYLGVSERTIRRLVSSRAIGHRRVAGLVRFTKEDLAEYTENIRVSVQMKTVV